MRKLTETSSKKLILSEQECKKTSSLSKSVRGGRGRKERERVIETARKRERKKEREGESEKERKRKREQQTRRLYFKMQKEFFESSDARKEKESNAISGAGWLEVAFAINRQKKKNSFDFCPLFEN